MGSGICRQSQTTTQSLIDVNPLASLSVFPFLSLFTALPPLTLFFSLAHFTHFHSVIHSLISSLCHSLTLPSISFHPTALTKSSVQQRNYISDPSTNLNSTTKFSLILNPSFPNYGCVKGHNHIYWMNTIVQSHLAPCLRRESLESISPVISFSLTAHLLPPATICSVYPCVPFGLSKIRLFSRLQNTTPPAWQSVTGFSRTIKSHGFKSFIYLFLEEKSPLPTHFPIQGFPSLSNFCLAPFF